MRYGELNKASVMKLRKEGDQFWRTEARTDFSRQKIPQHTSVTQSLTNRQTDCVIYVSSVANILSLPSKHISHHIPLFLTLTSYARENPTNPPPTKNPLQKQDPTYTHHNPKKPPINKPMHLPFRAQRLLPIQSSNISRCTRIIPLPSPKLPELIPAPPQHVRAPVSIVLPRVPARVEICNIS